MGGVEGRLVSVHRPLILINANLEFLQSNEEEAEKGRLKSQQWR